MKPCLRRRRSKPSVWRLYLRVLGPAATQATQGGSGRWNLMLTINNTFSRRKRYRIYLRLLQYSLTSPRPRPTRPSVPYLMSPSPSVSRPQVTGPRHNLIQFNFYSHFHKIFTLYILRYEYTNKGEEEGRKKINGLDRSVGV